ENVMDMDQHPRLKGWKELEKFEKHISMRPYHVRRVDEQDVPGLQLGKGLDGQGFHFCSQNFNTQLFQPRHLIGLDADMSTGVTTILSAVLFFCLYRQKRRISAADLDHPPGFEMTHDAVQEFRIRRA